MGKVISLHDARPPKFGAFQLPWMLRHLALVYGTTLIHDSENDIELSLRIARIAYGPPKMRQWLEHPQRRLMLPSDLALVVTSRRRAP